MDSTRIFYYTVGRAFIKILKQGYIDYLPERPDGRFPSKPHVICSTNPYWEPGANRFVMENGRKRFYNDMMVTHENYMGLVRIMVNPDAVPFSWDEYTQIISMNEMDRDLIRHTMKTLGSDVSDYKISLSRIEKKHWYVAEMYMPEIQAWEKVTREYIKMLTNIESMRQIHKRA